MAIKKAIDHIKVTTPKEVIIYTDSLSAIQTIESGNSKSNPKLLKQIQNVITEITKQGTKLEIHWIPSHVGISGNDIADNLAKASLNHPEIDEGIQPQLQDIYKHIDGITKEKWQILRNQETTGRQYHEIQPMVNNKIKYSDRKSRLKGNPPDQNEIRKVLLEALSIPDEHRNGWKIVQHAIKIKQYNTG